MTDVVEKCTTDSSSGALGSFLAGLLAPASDRYIQLKDNVAEALAHIETAVTSVGDFQVWNDKKTFQLSLYVILQICKFGANVSSLHA